MAENTSFDDFAHGAHMKEAFDLAREAGSRGDHPFGSVLVRDDEVIMRDSNHVVTEDDIRHHPELHLAYRACREFSPEERAEMVMYTSTEPCAMCAGGMRTAGFGRVVYSVASDETATFVDGQVRSAAVLIGVSEVVGPVSNEEGLQIHEDYEW